jgi:hypothetical protein
MKSYQSSDDFMGELLVPADLIRPREEPWNSPIHPHIQMGKKVVMFIAQACCRMSRLIHV